MPKSIRTTDVFPWLGSALLVTAVTLGGGDGPVQVAGLPVKQESSNIALTNTLANVTQARKAIAENVANAKSIGYKRNLVRFVDSGSIAVSRDVSQGELIRTNRGLDVAVEGNGCFCFTDTEGHLSYSRRGDLRIGEGGQIFLSTGESLEPGITIPPEVTDIRVAGDGMVTGKPPETSHRIQLGQVQLATFINLEGLSFDGRGLFSETEASGPATLGVASEGSFGVIRGGWLETSNVNTAAELRALADLQAYKSQIQSALDIECSGLPYRSADGPQQALAVVPAGHQQVAGALKRYRPIEPRDRREERISVSYDIGTLRVWQQEPVGEEFTLNASLLVAAIKSSIEPQSWDETTLIRQQGSSSLLVTHTPDIQRKVEAFMGLHSRDGRCPEPEQLVVPVFE